METTARYCSVLNSNLLAYVVAWIVVLNYPSPPPPCLWVCSSRQKRCHRTAEKQAEVWTSLGSITQTFLLGKVTLDGHVWKGQVQLLQKMGNVSHTIWILQDTPNWRKLCWGPADTSPEHWRCSTWKWAQKIRRGRAPSKDQTLL